MAKQKFNPNKIAAEAAQINPAIADLRDERVEQDKKLLRMEAFKTTAMVLGADKENSMSDILIEANKAYMFLLFGTVPNSK
ncbi:hypothetical protein H8D85_02235 [bacterium]|nr:hypothetical protein [bacterium]